MDIGDSLGHSIPPKRKPIIIESNTDQVDLSGQLVAPIACQYFGKYIQTTAAKILPRSGQP
jgi:hypothetical protein